ncbi:hypothetical protein [Micromonospora sp. 4G55]|uniref:hypothetical protein n=1 Tax=Micromonospora sp. 4G55 TaxID=2806102 RepID=UPI001A51283E|nr:hypothetical protein [Micromonospora sp. 4G55]MBM0257035.1 hypothetical protein [Micromonospora sp. 4G55]
MTATPPPPPPGGWALHPPVVPPPRKKFWTTPAGVASIVVVVGALLLIAVRVSSAVSGDGAATERCHDAIRAQTSYSASFIGRAAVVRQDKSYGVSGQLVMRDGRGLLVGGTYHCWVQREGWDRWTTTSATVARTTGAG